MSNSIKKLKDASGFIVEAQHEIESLRVLLEDIIADVDGFNSMRREQNKYDLELTWFSVARAKNFLNQD